MAECSKGWAARCEAATGQRCHCACEGANHGGILQRSMPELLKDEAMLPVDAPQNRSRTLALKYLRRGRCVICGKKKKDRGAFHCDACYTAIFHVVLDGDDE